MIAGLDIGHAFADRLDDPRGFMTEHAGCRMRIEPLDKMQIAVAQPGKGGAQQHLAGTGLGERDLLDRQRLVRGMQDGGFHRKLTPGN